MRLIPSAGAEEGGDRTGHKPLRCKAAPCPALSSAAAPALQPGLKGPGHVLQPWGHCHGDDHSPGEQLAVAGLGGGTCGSLGPPNAALQCKEPQCALIPGPGSSSAKPGGHWQHPLGWRALSHRCGAHPTVYSCVRAPRTLTCVHVLWVAVEGPCCSKLLATSRTIQSCQGHPRHSICSSSCRFWLSAVPAPVPAPLPATLPLVPQSRCRSPQHRAPALCEHRPYHGLAGECRAGHPGRR